VTDPVRTTRRWLVSLVLFSVVIGFCEAATVTYIRIMYEPIHQRLHPDRAPDDLFPLLNSEQWATEAPPPARSPFLEVTREIATILGVVFVARAVMPTFRLGMAISFLMLGVIGWTYYLWLKLLTGWPHAVTDWDMIFLLPLPWIGPVWAALASYTAMIAACAWFFWAEAVGRPLHAGRVGWLLLAAGSLVTALPFWLDLQHIASGGYPRSF